MRHDAGLRFEVSSAGTKPSSLRPEAVVVMQEIGIDISCHRSKSADEFARETFDYVITVCDNAKQSCPVFPAKTRLIHWSIEDPAGMQGLDEERRAKFRQVRDELRGRLKAFAAEQAES